MQILTYQRSLLTMILLLLITGCGEREGLPPAPTRDPGEAGAPTTIPTAVTPTASLDQLATPSVIAATATMATAPTLAPAVTETSVGVVLQTPADFGDNRNPLTGEEVADPSLLQRRPLAIKISNSPPQWVRPQAGLNDADLIFEHISEANITRFTLIVYGKTPRDVGPIRSARLIDLELPAMYDAALIYSGSSQGVGQRLHNSDFASRILLTNEPGYYRTGANKPLEHTLHGTPELFWQALGSKGLNTPPTFGSFMTFSDQLPTGGSPARQVDINYVSTLVSWRYDPGSGTYMRWSDGDPHLDANTSKQVRAANVVVVLANHVEDPTICEEIRNNVCAHLSVQVQIWGSGHGLIFRNGQRYEVTWQRVNRGDMLTFYDADGAPLPLNIGNSWFQVVPLHFTNPIAVTP